ncbi:MAG: histone deacetylase [Desulfomonile tiedjei]|uniref:Histone deacetylase n=1 Tax=Desulfomonile tiedjei TaxID=2358 RepID=A0A9D6UYD4_9BACT|nr:histone deacetylase [Desulfomonile tiedjei]
MTLKVAVVRDERYLVHQTGLVHPERPGRLKGIYRMLDKEFPEGLIQIEPEPVTLENLELVHTPGYIRKILKTSEREFTNLAPDTPASSQSYLAAWLAVGGCIKGLQALLAGRCDVCFCLVRPPGHHAQADRAGGFCIFNNLAITAKYAIERHGFRRILIVDWDIHHGNGIQEIFFEEDSVLYFSTHYLGWYPHTGDWSEVGSGRGLGYTVNVPVPKDVTDQDIVFLYYKILGPIMKSYKPELILVSAGFDGHHRDPLGRTQLTEQAFRWLTELVLELRDAVKSPPLLFSLEGGYDVGALSGCVREVLDVLTWKERRPRVPLMLSPKANDLVEKAQAAHRKYGVWAE